MNNNDILRRLRFALNLNDKRALKLFTVDPNTRVDVSVKQWHAILLKQEEKDALLCSDLQLQAFLDGLIIDLRGPRNADNPPQKKIVAQPSSESKLSRNDILKKLRIALNFKEEDMLETLKTGGSHLSKSELSAFFRKPGHKHYRACGNQVLRSFLVGLTKRMRNT